MKQQASAFVTLGGLVVVAVVLSSSAARVADLDSSIETLIRRHVEPEEQMQTLTEVVAVGDRKITVTTTQGAGELVGDFIARHNATVAALTDGR